MSSGRYWAADYPLPPHRAHGRDASDDGQEGDAQTLRDAQKNLDVRNRLRFAEERTEWFTKLKLELYVVA